MRRRSAIAIAVIVCTLILSIAVPAQGASRDRFYRGKTSQGHGITFRVTKDDDGVRSVKEMRLKRIELACDDGTTQVWGSGWIFGGFGPQITDGAFTYDEAYEFQATHFAGRLGRFTGEGTVRMTVPALTPDEQAQVCTSGDLTWEVEFVRTI